MSQQSLSFLYVFLSSQWSIMQAQHSATCHMRNGKPTDTACNVLCSKANAAVFTPACDVSRCASAFPTCLCDMLTQQTGIMNKVHCKQHMECCVYCTRQHGHNYINAHRHDTDIMQVHSYAADAGERHSLVQRRMHNFVVISSVVAKCRSLGCPFVHLILFTTLRTCR